jgi:hypothetical protein
MPGGSQRRAVDGPPPGQFPGGHVVCSLRRRGSGMNPASARRLGFWSRLLVVRRDRRRDWIARMPQTLQLVTADTPHGHTDTVSWDAWATVDGRPILDRWQGHHRAAVGSECWCPTPAHTHRSQRHGLVGWVGDSGWPPDLGDCWQGHQSAVVGSNRWCPTGPCTRQPHRCDRVGGRGRQWMAARSWPPVAGTPRCGCGIRVLVPRSGTLLSGTPTPSGGGSGRRLAAAQPWPPVVATRRCSCGIRSMAR